MKKVFLKLFTILLLFVSCDKENPDDSAADGIIVGGVYLMYTGVMVNSAETKVNICDSLYKFNIVEACYTSHEPTTNNNIFMVMVADSVKRFEYVRFDIFTRHIEAESFFKKDSFEVEKIRISAGGTREDFDNINTYFYWDTVNYKNGNFSGKARLKIPAEIIGKINPAIFYPKQELKFEF
jgi:hypothetical protein